MQIAFAPRLASRQKFYVEKRHAPLPANAEIEKQTSFGWSHNDEQRRIHLVLGTENCKNSQTRSGRRKVDALEQIEKWPK
jgi:hypothetical protein